MNDAYRIKDIIRHLETIAPLSYQESYDNAGLLTGNPDTPVQQVLVTLDCTETVMEEAIRKNCNLIVAHHPLIFGGIKRLTGSNEVERTLILAIKHDIAVYAIHTNLDNVSNGVNAKLAEKLGLSNCRILSPKKDLLRKLVTFVPLNHTENVSQALYKAGAGKIGEYDQCSFSVNGTGSFRGNENTHPFVGTPGTQHLEQESRIEVIFPAYLENQLISALNEVHPYEEPAYDIFSLENTSSTVGSGMVGVLPSPMTAEAFLKHVKEVLHTQVIRHTPFNGMIEKVAVCGGAGIFLLEQAIQSGAQAFVTADIKYHDFFRVDSALLLADAGHYESEFFTKELLKDLILKKFTTFAVLLSETHTNPIKYY
ncbi:MAG: Nif3-like dinuclear metal center hexameric protein [Bacteroidia bacterium]|jgi:dinuclear metal center YbgI/SA1388 family protein